jgi:hypothetical protein
MIRFLQRPEIKNQRMSESSRRSVDAGATVMQLAPAVRSPSEFDLGYYGWRVVLAAMSRCDGGIRFAIRLYIFGFCEAAGGGIRLEPRGHLKRLRHRRRHFGLISPLLGRWIDRFGPRRIILVCMTYYGCAIASLSLLHSGLWQFYVTCFVLGVVGNGAAHLAYSRSISTWFHRRLGMALAFVMVGAGLGAMILPVVAQSIISRSGWRAAYASLGGLALLLGLAPQLALHPRAWSCRKQGRSGRP